MIGTNTYLSPFLFQDTIEKVATRDGYGKGVVAAGKEDERVLVLCADLTESTRSDDFARAYPKRFIEVGVAEQNLATVASGMALAGKIPFIASYAAFSPGRNTEQIRTTIALNDVNVKVVGAHAGISVGPDGATHQALEDISLMRSMPNMRVVSPCDAIEAEKAVRAAARIDGPVYIRLGRSGTPVMTTEQTPYAFGKAEVFWEGSDVTIIATGPLVYEALKAAKELEGKKVSTEVINLHTIKPLDGERILQSVQKTGAVVTVEEHQVAGGMGSAVSEFLVQNLPVPVEMVGMQDRFGESGEAGELMDHFNLSAPSIIQAVTRVISRK